MFEKKFAIIKTVGNDEKALKYFNKDEKEKALAYGAEVAEKNDTGVISCVLGYFDGKGRMVKNECRVYEVWVSEKKEEKEHE